MVGSELAYVQAQLARYTHSEWKEIAESAGVSFRTVKRIGYKEISYPRSDTVGKLAIHFQKKHRQYQSA